MSLRNCFLVWCLGLLACGPQVRMSRSGPKQAARPEDCQFRVFTVAPRDGYAEIGAVDLLGEGFMAFTDELHEFKDAIREKVCKAGGDAVIAWPNGKGEYIKATILKRVAVERAAPATQPAPASAASPTDDCHYDTQCKGDRICEGGRCVSPPAPSTAPTTPPSPPPASSAETPPVNSAKFGTAKPASTPNAATH